MAKRSKNYFLKNYAALKGFDPDSFMTQVRRAGVRYGLRMRDLEAIARSALTWEIKIGEGEEPPIAEAAANGAGNGSSSEGGG